MSELPFSILRPVVAPTRAGGAPLFERVTPAQLGAIFTGRQAGDVMALDWETRGFPWEPLAAADDETAGSVVVGVALADKRGAMYIDLVSSPGVYEWLVRRLHAEQVPLIAHNVPFDGAWPLRDFGLWLNWQHDTHALLRLMATEGWPGQGWSLKQAMTDLLGWPATNEADLDRWLVAKGYVRQVRKEEAEGFWPAPPDEDGTPRWASAEKGEMWRAPASILGRYSAMDADACYLLYQQVLLPCLERFDGLRAYASPERYGVYLRLLVQQQARGIAIDGRRLVAYAQELQASAAAAEEAFYAHPDVAKGVAEWNRQVVNEHLAKEPDRYRRFDLGKEPIRYRKDGAETKSWQAWDAKRQAGPQQSKSWENWSAKLAALSRENHFNLASGQQKQWLFYTALGNPVELWTTAETPQPAVDEKALGLMGEPGRLLIEWTGIQKELSYVEQAIAKLRADALVPGGVCLRPGFRVPGTLTGRLAGSGGLNVQQMPKSQDFLVCWQARPGYRLVELDFTALEQVVLAELSQDPGLLQLYSVGRPCNDAYLFTGAHLPVLGPAIRAAGYDPERPTPEGIAAAKKGAKKERQIAKVVVLASSYGAGAKKIHQTLRLSGVHISESEAKAIHAGYWELYAGVKRYERELLRQWTKNDGWFLNGIGRPVGLAEGWERDIVNRCVQSTGHDCLVLYISILAKLLDEAGLDWHPWIADLHDEVILEVREDQAEAAAAILEGPAMQELNDLLRGSIPLRGGSEVVDNFAAIKTPS